MTQYTISRDGMPPIRFTGEQIAKGSDRVHNSTRWTNVELFLTKGGKYVASINRRTQWQGERDSTVAMSFTSAADVIAWLSEQTGNSVDLSQAAQEAVEAAAKRSDTFAAAWVENVD